jgi:hypothetical protein
MVSRKKEAITDDKGAIMKIRSAKKLPIGTIIELEEDNKFYKVVACDRIAVTEAENFGLTLEEVDYDEVQKRR